MARKIAVIGMGHVGYAAAHHIIVTGAADELTVVDKNEKWAEAEALDFDDSMANLPFHTQVYANDWERVGQADVVISAVGKVSLVLEKQDRFAELPHNVKAVHEVSQKLVENGFHGKIVVITNPCDAISGLYQRFTGLPKAHVMGTGTLLDSGRMQRAVGKAFNVDPRSVRGYNLGEHGNSQFTAWSTVRVMDKPVTELAKERGISLDDIAEEARMGGWTVAQAKRYTNSGVSAAAVRLARIIMSDARTALPVSNYRDDYGCYLSYPAVVGADGVVEQEQLDLTDDELAKLQNSADFINQKTEEGLKDLED